MTLRPSALAFLSAALAAVLALPACGAPPERAADGDAAGGDAPVAISEADLGVSADEESFAAYDAGDDEIAAAREKSALDDEVVLYAIPAPRLVGLSWNSPGGLARRTLLSNGLGFSRALGHAAVRVSCKGRSFLGSVVDTGDDFRRMVLEEKVGLGVLFRTVPGALESARDLQRTIEEREKNGRLSFVRFAVSHDTCVALLDFAAELDRRAIPERYGFVRPLYREGAGCSAFTMAFLELARLDEARFREAWSFDVRVPMALVGGAGNPGNRVTVFELLTTFRPWARPDEPHERLVGWDPTKMFTSIRRWARRALASGAEDVERRGRALGLLLDRRGVAPRAELANRTYWAGDPGAPRDYWGFGDP